MTDIVISILIFREISLKFQVNLLTLEDSHQISSLILFFSETETLVSNHMLLHKDGTLLSAYQVLKLLGNISFCYILITKFHYDPLKGD